ncbi:tyrosine-type recombinase/integrase [Hyphomicrobium facile]|uniref:tyrosine-type recombinase/integrase n=1 Tax=Hyphomicrobium facile TaxID=51670 RepID=UPI000B85BE93|nr:hypothetical protein [Hyphomicrobium facile]
MTCLYEQKVNALRASLQIQGEHVPTFREAFQGYFSEKKQSLSNAKHIAQWESTMEAYVFAKIGDMSVEEIGSQDISAIIDSIWHDKPETASRVLGRIREVLDFSIAYGLRTKVNPCEAIRCVLASRGRKVRRTRLCHIGKIHA